MKQTLYTVLGVDPKASLPEIVSAYQRLAGSRDAAQQDAAMQGLLKQAVEVLSDSAARAAYDASLVQAAVATPYVHSDSALQPRLRSPFGWIAIVVLAAATVAIGAWWVLSGHSQRKPPSAMPVASVQPPPAAVVPAAPVTAPVPATAATPIIDEAPASGPIAAAATPVERAIDPAEQPGSAATSVPVRPIEARASPRAAEPSPQPPGAGSAETVFADVAPSVARVNVLDANDRSLGNGSGVVIATGVILTSCHVAKSGTKLTVKIGELTLPATIAMADDEFDLCRLQVAGLRAAPVRVGTVAALRTGQKVFAIGAPAGLELTISEGIVSSLRKVDEGTVIQTTAPISPGSSGGGLFDASGQLVGIMTFQHRFGQNLNFALPADWIAQMRPRTASQMRWSAAAGGERVPSMIVGEWLCRDWISGRTGRYRFDPYGRVSIAMADFPEVSVNYGVSGKSLQLYDSQKAISLAIGELSQNRLIFKGVDRNIACER